MAALLFQACRSQHVRWVLTTWKQLAAEKRPVQRLPSPSDWLQSSFICIPLFTQRSVTLYLTAFHRPEASQQCKPQVNSRRTQKALRLPSIHLHLRLFLVCVIVKCLRDRRSLSWKAPRLYKLKTGPPTSATSSKSAAASVFMHVRLNGYARF